MERASCICLAQARPSTMMSLGDLSRERDDLLIRVALALAVFAGAASMRVLDAVLPIIAQHYRAGLGTTGGVVSAYALSYSICQVFYGPLGDRKGLLRVVTWAATGSAIAAAACAAAPSLTLLIAGRFAAGGVAAAIGPLALAWISQEAEPSNRAVSIARMSLASIIGTTAGQVGGGLVGQFLGWRSCFLVVAAFFGFAAILLHFLTRQKRYRSGSEGARTVGRLLPVDLLRLPAVQWVLIAVAVEGVGMYTGFTYVSALLRSSLVIDTAEAGLLVSFFGLGGCAFIGTARTLIRHWSTPVRIAAGASAAGAAFIALGFVSTAPEAALVLFILGFGFFLLHNVFQVRATEMAPFAVGASVSLFASTFFLAQAVGAGVGGCLVDRLGPQLPPLLSGMLLIAFGLSVRAWYRVSLPRMMAES